MALAAAVLVLPATAAGADDSWQLSWQAPPECPRAAEIEARVTALLGGSPGGPQLRVRAAVERTGDEWRLRLLARRGGASQRRVLRHRDCATLGEATALLVALAVDPVGTKIDPRLMALLRAPAGPATPPRTATPVQPATREPEPWVSQLVIDVPVERRSPAASTPSPTPSLTPAPSPATAAAPTPSPTPVRPATATPAAVASPAPAPARAALERWAALRIGGGAALGATPGVSGGFVGAAGLGLGRRGRLELTASWWAPTRTRLAASPGAGADVSLATGGLRGCFAPGRAWLEVPLCLGVEFGSMRARGFGVADARVERSLWSALTLGAAVALVPAPRWAVWLAVDGHLALNRPQFLIDGGGEVWRGGRAGVRATLALEVRFRAMKSRLP
ncbi:hypothetical protein OV203_11695 [Nannocystis sp. ILAH1]|uniref:hypothetical protein n=1 Tax=Nannocystis sp. ILAH1 TaxID=2996789 RepID=UPI00226DBC09|nr:hypothetical protein [Nannocystis sp. ILAH1]MCY0987793.1 hypothetical protein [Nannocystis sp. ILAH1]